MELAGEASAMVTGGGGIGMDAGGMCAEATPDTGVGGGALGRSDRLLRGLTEQIAEMLASVKCRRQHPRH